jgi:pimeloyl-ACP methyl ester carboxylesterase
MKLFENYQKFLEHHEVTTYNFMDEKITYRFFGQGEKVILMLLGSSMFSSEAYFKLFEELENGYKILTINYSKTIQKIDEFMSVVIQVLDILKINHVYLLGASHGGGLAQVFAKNYPNRVIGLMLYNTLTNTKLMNSQSKEIINQVLTAIEELKELRKIMPLNQIKSALLNQIEESLVDKNDIEFFEYLISKYDEKDEQIQMFMIKDLLANYEFELEDFNYLNDKVLILYGHDDDPFGGTELIESLVELMPKSKLSFIESDRFSLVLDSNQFAKEIKEFIK